MRPRDYDEPKATESWMKSGKPTSSSESKTAACRQRLRQELGRSVQDRTRLARLLARPTGAYNLGHNPGRREGHKVLLEQKSDQVVVAKKWGNAHGAKGLTKLRVE